MTELDNCVRKHQFKGCFTLFPLLDEVGQRCFIKTVFLKISENSRKGLVQEYLFKLATLFKRDSSTVYFMWILWNVEEHLFCRTSINDYFCTLSKKYIKAFKWQLFIDLLQNSQENTCSGIIGIDLQLYWK